MDVVHSRAERQRQLSRGHHRNPDASDEDSFIGNNSMRYRTLDKSKSSVFLPRLVNRNLTYNQSKNRFAVKNINGSSQLWPLLVRDWFHVLLRLPFHISIVGLLAIWTLLILAWAAIYVLVDTQSKEEDCGLGEPGFPIPFSTAFAFSLETCTTVGYGLPGSTNAFFESNCPSVQVSIFFQMLWSMMFNAFLFAFFYNWLSKCESRGTQVVFSNKLVVKVDSHSGKIVVCTRCYDIDARHPVVEAHVRMYVIDRRLKMHLLRVQEPDDAMGACLHISVPTEIYHHVDHHSPLSPRGMPLVVSDNGLLLRSADSPVGNRPEIVCPVCGDTFGTYKCLRDHVAYLSIMEKKDELPIEGTHQGFEMPTITPISLQEVKSYVENFMSEIVVVVEGIDPQVSGTFQALQSYKYEDMAWEGSFEPCLKVQGGQFCVDLAKFHQVRMPLSPPPSASDQHADAERGLFWAKEDNTNGSEAPTTQAT